MIGTDDNAPFIHNNSDCKCKNSCLCYPCHKHVNIQQILEYFSTLNFENYFAKNSNYRDNATVSINK